MNKLRRSTYLCTPSGNRKQGKSLVCAQFVHSTHFSLTPQKGAVKNYRFLQLLITIPLSFLFFCVWL